MKRAILVAAILLISGLGLAEANKDASAVVIGAPADFPVGTIRPFAQHKFIVFSDKDGIYCISTRCTHKGCTVAFKKDDGIFACPCHGARYARDGAVTRGPAREALAWFQITLDSGRRLVVDKNILVPAGTKYKFESE